MIPGLRLDKKRDTPAYKQLIEGITTLVREGKIAPGEKLPAERDLAEELDLSRGTVKRAYGELARSGIIEVTQGRGSFVSARQNVISSGRKEDAIALIETLLTRLENMRFSYREVRNLIELKIIEREERRENFFIAAVDCNPEALSIYEKQLAFIASVRVVKVLLDGLTRDPAPERRMEGFEVIITTSTHYTELMGLLPGLRERIVQVVVSPSQNTIIDLAAITSSQKIGVVCESQKFLSIILGKLKDFKIVSTNVEHRFISDDSHIGDFLRDKQVVIVPPNCPLLRDRAEAAAVQEFTQRGGKVIAFDFQIERGSLLYVEERIKALLSKAH